MASIQYTFKGQKLSLDILTSTTVADFLELIAEQTQVPVSGLKVMFKGKVLRPEESEESKPILEQHPVLASGAKIFVLGTTEQDLAKVQAIDQHINTRKNYRPPPTAKRSQPVRTLDDDDNKYVFGDIQVLPQFNQQDKARAILERLRMDKGIVGIMKLHQWRVGSLIELSPAEKSILGYNRNKGQLIALRLRTDDLEGFRHYDAIRKVLLHELAHNVWGDHDDNFHALNRQLNKEVQQLDWTAHGGRNLSKDTFFDPANGLTGYHDDLEDHGEDAQSWRGGTFVLGGGSRRAENSGLTTRELVARAAQLRQIESEKDEDGMCGAK
ncbi:MAG: WLM domain-containing protein [Benniella sp.]|nr:MAG: WLM domain-containing protein [Benniella sp.]